MNSFITFITSVYLGMPGQSDYPLISHSFFPHGCPKSTTPITLGIGFPWVSIVFRTPKFTLTVFSHILHTTTKALTYFLLLWKYSEKCLTFFKKAHRNLPPNFVLSRFQVHSEFRNVISDNKKIFDKIIKVPILFFALFDDHLIFSENSFTKRRTEH